jgi:hypothetical protein
MANSTRNVLPTRVIGGTKMPDILLEYIAGQVSPREPSDLRNDALRAAFRFRETFAAPVNSDRQLTARQELFRALTLLEQHKG